MERRIRLLTAGLLAGVALVASACGGGGGGSTPPAPTTNPNAPTPTVTPLRSGSSRNEVTQASDDGSITLRVQDVVIAKGASTPFTVLLYYPNGQPAVGQRITFESGPGLQVTLPDGDLTRQDGSLTGSVLGLAGG